MAVVDPYASCPCGSGNKFKWCCQKVESYADKANRQYENGQVQAALTTLDEGLAKAPNNAWLMMRKALILVESERSQDARPLVEAVLREHPAHLGAHALLIRLRLEQDGPKLAIDQLQYALASVAPDLRPRLASMAMLIGAVLGRVGFAPGAVKHLELARQLGGARDDERSLAQMLETVRSSPSISPWLRDERELSPAPEGLDHDRWERFQQGLKLADEGRWSTAAATFDLLEAQGVPGADRNLGLTRLWLMDLPGAAEALRRASRRLGDSPEAVDLEALCQLLEPVQDSDQVEHVHLIWTLRDRAALLDALRRSDRAQDAGEEPLDPDDPASFNVQVFELLDRPKPAGEPPADARAWPRVLGRALIGREIAIVETYDDGRLDGLSSWFTELAGSALPPAQPRTKVLDRVPRSDLALRSDLWTADDLADEKAEALQKQEVNRLLTEVWPDTPLPYLGGKTPRQAASDPWWRTPLRAALCRFEENPQFKTQVDFAALRNQLGVPAEPDLDPATVDIARVPLTRLAQIPADRLDDDRLVALYKRAHEAALATVSEQAAHALISRPELLDRSGIGRVTPYSDLSLLAAVREGKDAAQAWIDRGRDADPNARGSNAARWDMLEVRVRALTEHPETWVPHLAVVLERHRENQASAPFVLSHLMDLGLVRMVPHPENPGQILLDSRPLQGLLAEYGPRITTASGTLGVSASQGGIWTPDQQTGGSTTSGGIWTPGAPSQGGGDKPKLIIPGR